MQSLTNCGHFARKRLLGFESISPMTYVSNMVNLLLRDVVLVNLGFHMCSHCLPTLVPLFQAKRTTNAHQQEHITRSEQLPCACVTAFSRIRLFLERFWREFWISFKFSKFHKPVSKTYRPKNDIFCLLITLSFPFWYLLLHSSALIDLVEILISREKNALNVYKN